MNSIATFAPSVLYGHDNYHWTDDAISSSLAVTGLCTSLPGGGGGGQEAGSLVFRGGWFLHTPWGKKISWKNTRTRAL